MIRTGRGDNSLVATKFTLRRKGVICTVPKTIASRLDENYRGLVCSNTKVTCYPRVVLRRLKVSVRGMARGNRGGGLKLTESLGVICDYLSLQPGGPSCVIEGANFSPTRMDGYLIRLALQKLVERDKERCCMGSD